MYLAHLIAVRDTHVELDYLTTADADRAWDRNEALVCWEREMTAREMEDALERWAYATVWVPERARVMSVQEDW